MRSAYCARVSASTASVLLLRNSTLAKLCAALGLSTINRTPASARARAKSRGYTPLASRHTVIPGNFDSRLTRRSRSAGVLANFCAFMGTAFLRITSISSAAPTSIPANARVELFVDTIVSVVMMKFRNEVEIQWTLVPRPCTSAYHPCKYRLEAWDTPRYWRIGRGANLRTSSDQGLSSGRNGFPVSQRSYLYLQPKSAQFRSYKGGAVPSAGRCDPAGDAGAMKRGRGVPCAARSPLRGAPRATLQGAPFQGVATLPCAAKTMQSAL